MNAVAEQHAADEAIDEEIAALAADCYYDPLKWVLAIYPWKQPGSFLDDEPGPDTWQVDALRAIGQELLLVDMGRGATNAAQIAIASGHGPGKSTLAAWIIQWWLSTRGNPAMNVTAATQAQLDTKTWRELQKWYQVSLNRHWFKLTASSLYLIKHDISVANAIPWSIANPQAFAGLHEKDPAVIFDEASTIDDSIWKAQEGAFTTPGGLWVVVGNLTESSGKFYDCFQSKYWRKFNIDTRTCRKADKVRIAQWADEYGVDSDFFRVRVLGLAPKGGDERLFTPELLDAAEHRNVPEEWILEDVPSVMGIDPGGGAAPTAIVMRRGPLIKREWIIRFSESNHMKTASLIATHLSTLRPDYAFMDCHGLGKGIFDRIRMLGYSELVDVYAGDRSAVVDSLNYYNPRAEWYGRLAAWMKSGKVPNDRDLRDELLRQPMEKRNMKLQLMSKDDMRSIGLESPNTADAASLTFAEIVSGKPVGGRGGGGQGVGIPEFT